MPNSRLNWQYNNRFKPCLIGSLMTRVSYTFGAIIGEQAT